MPENFFVEQPAVLANLQTSLIATIPIFMLHSPDRGAFGAHFETVELPMIKVVEFDGTKCKDGVLVIANIIEKRVQNALIKEDALPRLIDKTGGLLRDVFEVLVVAAGVAQSQSERKKQAAVITKDNVRYALNRLRREYAQSLSSINLPEEWQQAVKVDDLYKRIGELKGKSHKNVRSEPVTMVLLQARALMEYNGEGWYSIHPLVRELVETD